jgi:hypothetical protein
MRGDPLGDALRTHKQLVQDCYLEIRIKIVSGGFVIATYKDLTRSNGKIFELILLCVSTQQPRKSGKVRVNGFVKRTKSIIYSRRNRYDPPLSTCLNSLHSRNPTGSWRNRVKNVIAKLSAIPS